MSNFKFKKGVYNRALLYTIEGKKRNKVKYEKTKGLLSPNFGFNYKTKELQSYIVTHLKTGYSIGFGVFDRLEQTKQFVQEVEQIPSIEKMDMNNARDYRDKIENIAMRIRTKRGE
jgi:hypothetical protein